ncbi:MAG: acyl-coenzyme A thioesterase PaaI-like protein [Nitriliruptoraceae bacterium]|jgi:acyl-coenzyme A thioesterase PaaI-like protein
MERFMDSATATGLVQAIDFVKRSGLEVVSVEPGRCVLRMPAEPNVNHFGTMYAGALYTLGEVPGGVLFYSTFDAEKFFPLVKESTIRYRRPARGAISVEASIADADVARLSAEAAEHGKANFDLSLDLTDEDGEVVAIMTSAYQMRTHGSV